MCDLTEKIQTYIDENTCFMPYSAAKALGVSEGQFLLHLPKEYVRIFEGNRAQEVMEKLSQWGKVLTLIIHEGSVFEISGDFPQGEFGKAYYNLKEGIFHGHIQTTNIDKIVFSRLPFMGRESANIAFLTQNAEVMFNVYFLATTGEEKEKQLIQFEQFY